MLNCKQVVLSVVRLKMILGWIIVFLIQLLFIFIVVCRGMGIYFCFLKIDKIFEDDENVELCYGLLVM